ncbi:MAG: S8 family serine peptidase, partial [Planctomycetes bacterium]|nr:S8 family serine peptidase [Planctomycetota bacterium]
MSNLTRFSAALVLALPAAGQLRLETRAQVIVQVPRAVDRTGVEASLERGGWRVLEELPALGLLLVEVPLTQGLASAIARLSATPGVAFAEANGSGEGGEIVPNDTHFGVQWPLDNRGQGGGRAGADIEALRAWSLARGSAAVTVAVLDSGLTPAHPEFAGRVLPGIDFVNEDADPFDDQGHGTFVSGILAANADNAFGLAGVDHACALLPVKVLNQFNGGTVFDLTQGLVFAADAGAHVVNMSLINYPQTTALESALEYARNAGCVLVACAGNGGIGDADRSYPGRSPLTISVGATTDRDLRAVFSGTGNSLDLVAPGERVPATLRALTDGWTAFSGCSAATPIVSGMAAVLLSVDPTLTHDEIKQRLEAGAEDGVGSAADTPGRDNHYGHGRANLFRSLCLLDTGGPSIVAPAVLRLESPGPGGLSADDPAVIAALKSILAVDDLDPAPRLQVVSPGPLPLGKLVALAVTALDACGHATQRTLEIIAEDRG